MISVIGNNNITNDKRQRIIRESFGKNRINKKEEEEIKTKNRIKLKYRFKSEQTIF